MVLPKKEKEVALHQRKKNKKKSQSFSFFHFGSSFFPLQLLVGERVLSEGVSSKAFLFFLFRSTSRYLLPLKSLEMDTREISECPAFAQTLARAQTTTTTMTARVPPPPPPPPQALGIKLRPVSPLIFLPQKRLFARFFFNF